MKIIFLLLFLISNNLYAKDLKVLWWNIGENRYSEDRGGYTNLDETIQSRDFSKFDVIGFGEYIEENLTPQSVKYLKKNFKYRTQLKYNKHQKRKILILSKHPFKGVTSIVDWVDTSLSVEKIKNYREQIKKSYRNSMKSFKRTYNRISMTINNKEYHFVFYHFNNPWPSLNSARGKYATATEILLGTKNPLMHQIHNFFHALKSDLGENYKEKKVILMGDSNCPYSVKGLRSACMRRMKKYVPLVLDHSREHTFPSPYSRTSQNYPKVKIDHAQVTKAIAKKSLEVLQWEGSDHLPLQLTIRD